MKKGGSKIGDVGELTVAILERKNPRWWSNRRLEEEGRPKSPSQSLVSSRGKGRLMLARRKNPMRATSVVEEESQARLPLPCGGWVSKSEERKSDP